jgi:hypothetical protein
VTGRTCTNCGAGIDRHFICTRCAEEWQSRPYAHYVLECFTDGAVAIIGVHANGSRSPDLLNLTTAAHDHPMLGPTEAEFNGIYARMQAFLGLTTEELDVVLEATDRAAPELSKKLRTTLHRSL